MKFNSDFLNLYLQYVEDTESPRIFHLGAILTGVAASLGRRLYFPFGITNIYPNMYTILVGPPGARKSTTGSIVNKLLKEYTGVKFAPDDTGGQRQGLLMAMSGEEVESQALEALIDSGATATMEGIEQAGSIKLNLGNPADTHVMYAFASEFTTLIGDKSTSMLTFLIRMWDGDDYRYRIKSEDKVLHSPLMSILGCTTTTQIVAAMPEEAMGQGFMSRLMIMFARDKYKSVPRPRPFDPALEREIGNTLSHIFYNLVGPMEEERDAALYLDKLYTQEVKINDTRFIYYCERRHTHLIKLTMAVCATRGSKRITIADIEDALAILRAAELGMPEALGEFGLSPIAKAKQRLVEFLQSAKQAISADVLWVIMQKDMRSPLDFQSALSDLSNAKKIKLVQTDQGAAYVALNKKTSAIEELLGDLTEEEASNVVRFKLGAADE